MMTAFYYQSMSEVENDEAPMSEPYPSLDCQQYDSSQSQIDTDVPMPPL